MDFTVKSENCILKCKIRGRGLPLILIHGVASDAEYFHAAAEELSKDFSVITYDRRGYSESKAEKEADYSVHTQAEDAALVIKGAGFESAAVVGCSAGGLIALELAYNHPEMVDKLFLHEPPIGVTEEDRKAIGDWLSKLEVDAQKKKLTKAMLHFYAAIGGTDPSAPSLPLERQVRNLENMKTFLYHELYDFLTYHKKLEGKKAPLSDIVIASGSEDEKGIFSKAGVATAEVLGVKSLIVPGYHNLPNERPKVFADVVRKWSNGLIMI